MKKKKRSCLLFLLLFSPLFSLNPHEYQNFRETVNASHERSYIAPGNFGDVNDLIFEGRFSNHFFINFRRNADWAADASINLTLRMLNKESVPIYTPSYNPGINFYHFSKNGGLFEQDVIYALGLYHYSNGQDGNYQNDDGTINYKNGNFSTNYIALKSFSLHRDSKRDNVKQILGSQLLYYFETYSHMKADFPIARFDINIESLITDWQTKAYSLFGISKQMREDNQEIYNLNRIKINLGMYLGYMKQNKFLEDRITLETTYSYKPFWLDDFSFFAKYYYGKDYYNIHFNEKISQLTVGIMTDNFTFRSDK